MADKDDIREGKDFGIGIPQENRPFFVKGNGALDWGMQNRLARIFNLVSGRTVIPPSATKAVVLRCSGGQSILTELSREAIAVDIEDAIRLNAAAITTQIYIGAGGRRPTHTPPR